ncbi:serine protease inhibitor ecotin [Shewanella sp. MEBiC00475]|uniref:serine protease inhibitor ecotin n=1 Tax=Shewanella sp. MEBiC00475 TaxID=2575361 RepID=UPI0010C0069C|nr:serine protease inhibitor ecotin [Shewanella sp. MEBiC00475]
MLKLPLSLTILLICTTTIMTCLYSPFAHAANPEGKINIVSTVMNSDDYQALSATKMYPVPEAGMVQHILTLPALNNEQQYLLEVQIGQQKMVDCNKVRLIGEISSLSLPGWGYIYYQVDNIIQGPNTLMMCTEPKKEKFIVLNKSMTQPYDSRQPIVFYLPEGTDLRYRVWKTASDYVFSGQ